MTNARAVSRRRNFQVSRCWTVGLDFGVGFECEQHQNDIKVTTRLMFPLAIPFSVDDSCRLSRLQTCSKDAKTPVLFFPKFHFSDTNPRREKNAITMNVGLFLMDALPELRLSYAKHAVAEVQGN